MSNLSISITAQTTDLQTKLALASAAVKDFSAETRGLAAQIRAAGANASGEMVAGLTSAATSAAAARTEVAGLKTEIAGLNASGGGSGLFSGISSSLQSIESSKASLIGFGEAFAAVFAVDKISEWTSKTAEAGAQVAHLSQQLGLSAQQVTQFEFAAGAMGIGTEQAAMAMERLERNMSQAAKGTGPAAEGFKALGISVQDGAGNLKSLDEILPEIANRFAESANGPEKTAVAIALLGRAGAEMIPFLNQGAAGLERFNQIAAETGTVLTDQMAAKSEETSIEIYTLGKAVDGTSISLFQKLEPSIDATVKGLTELVENFTKAMQAGTGLSTIIDGLAFAFKAGLAIIETWSMLVQEAFQFAVIGALQVLGPLEALGVAFRDLFHPAQLKADVAAVMDATQRAVQERVNNMKAIAADYQASIKGMYDPPTADAGDGAPKEALGEIGTSGGSASNEFYDQQKAALDKLLLDYQIFGDRAKTVELNFWKQKLETARAGGAEYEGAVREIQSRIYSLESEAVSKAAENALREAAAKKQALSAWWQDYSEGIRQQIAAASGNTAEQIKLTQDWVATGQALYGQNTRNYKDALNQQSINAKAVLEEQKRDLAEWWAQYSIGLKEQIAAAAGNRDQQIALIRQWVAEGKSLYGQNTQNYKNALDAQTQEAKTQADELKRTNDEIASKFSSDVLSMLQGHKTFTQEVTALSDQLLQHLIENFAKMALSWGENLLGMQTASAAVNVGTGIGAAASAGSSGGGILSFLGSAAGFLGFLASGTDNVPRDGLAYLHQGEIVVPPTQAQSIRSLNLPVSAGVASSFGSVAGKYTGSAPTSGANSGVALTVNVNALDGASVNAWANANARVLAQTISAHMSLNPGPAS